MTNKWTSVVVRSGFYAATGLVILSGCGREEVRVYSAPKEAAAPPATAPVAHNPADPHAAHGGHVPSTARIKAQAPTGWQEKAAEGMRVAHYLIPGKDNDRAEVSVMPMPGLQAAKDQLVNLWRQQLGLKPVEPNSPELQGQKAQIGSDSGELFDLAGEPAAVGQPKVRIVVAMLNRAQTMWFFKLAGTDDLVTQNKSAFADFLKTVTFVEADNAPAAPVTPPMGMGMPPHGMSAAATAGLPALTIPSAWKQEAPTPMVSARYSVTADNGKAIITVSSLDGDGGGLLANVNRWRGQLKLSPVDQAELAKISFTMAVPGGSATVVDMAGTDAKTGSPARMIAVNVPQGGRTWFYKLMGDSEIVDKQKATFTAFFQSAKY